MNAVLRAGSDDAVYLLIGERRYRIAPEEVRPLLFFCRAVPVTGEGRSIAGYAAVNAAGRAVRIFTPSGAFSVPLVSFRRVVTGEAASAPLFPLVPEEWA
jgi:hypothetical protein